jgi:hypothetical protein
VTLKILSQVSRRIARLRPKLRFMRCQRSLLLLALIVIDKVPPLLAQESVHVAWSQVCKEARGRQMRLTTNTGDTVEGYCVSVSVDEISLRTPDQRAVKIARAAMARIVVTPQGSQLQALGRGMRKSLRTGFRALLSPCAPAGIVLIPATLAWGALSAPFARPAIYSPAKAPERRFDRIEPVQR